MALRQSESDGATNAIEARQCAAAERTDLYGGGGDTIVSAHSRSPVSFEPLFLTCTFPPSRLHVPDVTLEPSDCQRWNKYQRCVL